MKNTCNTLSKSERISLLTHFLERYDIGLFIFCMPILVSTFMPGQCSKSTFYSSLLFSSAYLVRPFGSILFGYIGDRYGRKKSFLLSIYLMLCATLGVALLPSYHLIGISSSFILFFLRMLQGIASGGEFTSVVLLITENSNEENESKNLILLRIAGLGGILLAGIISFSTIHFLKISWRYLFFIGFFLCILNIWLRSNIKESKKFEKEKNKKNLLKFPLKNVIYNHKLNLSKSLIIGSFGPSIFYAATVFFPDYYKLEFNNILIKVVIIFFWCLLTYSHIFSVKFISSVNLLKTTSIVVFIISFLFIYINSNITLVILFILLSYFGSIYFALSPHLYQKLFKTNMRHSGISLGISLGQGTFGGTSPLILSFIFEKLQLPILAVLFFMGLSSLSYLSIARLKN